MAGSDQTSIYHITHVDNLAAIVAKGGLLCDRRVADDGLAKVGIAHQHIKKRRAQRPVPIGPRGTLDDYVPFYFAPRSPMLYAIDRGNVDGYAGGQRSVVHLVSSAGTIAVARLPFVFTDGHAEMALSEFFDDLDNLTRVDWKVMAETHWADTDEDGDRKRRRQAEFLVHQFVPWSLVARIGVLDTGMVDRVVEIVGAEADKSFVTVEPGWCY